MDSLRVDDRGRHPGYAAKRTTANGAFASAVRDIVNSVDQAPTEVVAGAPPIALPSAQPGYELLFDETELKQIAEWVATLSGDCKVGARRHIEKLASEGPVRWLCTVPDMSALDEVDEQFPNFHNVTEFIRMRVVLCRLGPGQVFQLPPLLLSGPPGVGKTAYIARIASIIDAPCRVVDVATLTSPFAISGLDLGYGNGRPGLVWDALQGQCMSPVFVLDELDKATDREDVLGFLYTLLEPSSAKRFCDSAMRLPLNAAHIQWFATCNSTTGVDAAILSRFREFPVTAPTEQQARAVARSVHGSLLRGEPWGAAFDPQLASEVLDILSACTPREMRQRLEDACARAAMEGRTNLTAADVQAQVPQARTRTMGFI